MTKPNILFIGPFRQFCGWAMASKDYARALSTVANVTIRNIYLSNQREKNLPPDLQLLENNKFDNYDVVIQKTLPSLYYYDGRFKQNIGLTVFETELTHHNWFNNMNLMDKILVPSGQEKRWLEKKLKNKVFNISEALDITVADKKYQPLNPALADNKTFKFLFIGENIPRKGILKLIEAYFGEFSVNDNVLLILKTNGDITSQVENLKRNMRRFSSGIKYPPIFFIPTRLSADDIYSLHQHSDVFVMPSFGEAFNRPAATSLVFGKPVIATNNTGIEDYMCGADWYSKYGWMIDSYIEQVYCDQPPLPDLYSSKEYYYVPSVLSLRECMREAYQNKDQYNLMCSNIKNDNVKEKFSYETIGKNILEAINV